MLNGLDLFSGYGGAQDALRGLVRTVAYCEIERGAQRILLRRMRKGQINVAPIWDDVRTLRRGDIAEPIDIITGGFPCQDVSVAGMRKGLDGERSGLFFEIIRLVRDFRPRFIYLENVPGLLVRGMDRVSAELASLQYDHRAGVLSAFDVGANHLRERVWIVAHAKCTGQRRLQQIGELGSTDSVWAGGAGEERDVTDSASKRFQRWLEPSPTRSAFPFGSGSRAGFSGIPEPTICRGDDGFTDRRDRIRALGNGWVPQTAREAFKRLIGMEKLS